MDRNVLFQLDSLNIITNQVFAIYVDNKHGAYSTIKLGGWDKVGLKKGADLTMLKTASLQGWELQASDFKIGGASHKSTTRTVLFEPGVPYIYVNAADYAQLTTTLQALHPELICSSGASYCKFSKTCEEMKPELTGASRKWELILDDVDGNTFTADLHSEALYISGTEIGLSANECVISVFSSKFIPPSQWVLGTTFLQYYYTVYDMTPKVNNFDYIQVGIGEINPEDLIGESQYLRSSPAYNPAAGTHDMSVAIPGGGGALCFACPGPDVVVPIVHKPKPAVKAPKNHKILIIIGGSAVALVVIIVCAYFIRKKCRAKNAYYDRRYSQQMEPNTSRSADVSFDGN